MLSHEPHKYVVYKITGVHYWSMLQYPRNCPQGGKRSGTLYVHMYTLSNFWGHVSEFCHPNQIHIMCLIPYNPKISLDKNFTLPLHYRDIQQNNIGISPHAVKKKIIANFLLVKIFGYMIPYELSTSSLKALLISQVFSSTHCQAIGEGGC